MTSTRCERCGKEDEMGAIERELKTGELSYIDAIERLINLGYPAKDAERKVRIWENNHALDNLRNNRNVPLIEGFPRSNHLGNDFN